MLCDAGIVPVLDDDQGRPLDVGRKSRVFAGALRRALVTRASGCCQFPGCTHTRTLHGHHVRHWIDGGATRLENACLLCTRHHTLVHEGGFRVTAGPHGFLFLAPDGRPGAHQAPSAPVTLPALRDPPPVWDGDRVDYDAAVAWVAEPGSGMGRPSPTA